MNIIEAEDLVKGLPDQALFQEAQFPSGRIPQYLAVSEVQRRQDMRQRFQAAQQEQQPSVKDQILQGGIGSTGMAPEMSSMPPMAPQMPPQGGPMPPQMPPQMPPPMGMAMGGIVSRRMNTGGLTPGGIVRMQIGRTIPDLIKELKNAERSGNRNAIAAIRGQLEAAGAPISSVINQLVSSEAPPVAPPGADSGAEIYSNMMGRVPDTFKIISGLMPKVSGVSTASLERFKPTREEYFNPEQETRRADYLAQFNAMGDTRKAEDIAAAERYLKEAESPIQAAQDEARKAAISSTLMRLGAGIAAGKPAEGLASASEAVEQTLGRAREVASAERRAARQDYRTSEREAIRGQRSIADQAFMIQAQNITNDENQQREFVNAQRQFAQWAFTQQREAGRDQAAAFNNSLGLAIGISKDIQDKLSEMAREEGLNLRAYAQAVASVSKDVFGNLETITEMVDKRKTINGKPNPNFGEVIVDENGVAKDPTFDYLNQEARRQTDLALKQYGISNPNNKFVVEFNGESYKFPNLAAANKFKAAAGIR